MARRNLRPSPPGCRPLNTEQGSLDVSVDLGRRRWGVRVLGALAGGRTMATKLNEGVKVPSSDADITVITTGGGLRRVAGAGAGLHPSPTPAADYPAGAGFRGGIGPRGATPEPTAEPTPDPTPEPTTGRRRRNPHPNPNPRQAHRVGGDHRAGLAGRVGGLGRRRWGVRVLGALAGGRPGQRAERGGEGPVVRR